MADGAAAFAPARASRRRLVVFMLSPRVIDFDTYLPTALALKEARPDWQIRFVTFSAKNFDFIRRNSTLMRGLERCGTLHCLDAKTAPNTLVRWWRRISGFGRICVWVLRWKRPILFAGRQFSSGPYPVWFLLARLRRGRGIILAGGRGVDAGIHPHVQPRLMVSDLGPSMVRRLFGRDADALIHYHDRQTLYLNALNRWGTVQPLPNLCMGLPNQLEAWRRLVIAEAAAERERLRATGHPIGEIYCFFAPKTASSANLRTPDSAERTFRQILMALRQLRRKSTILVRPHPLAENAAYLSDTLGWLHDPHIVVSLAHPEVLIALSRRAIVNAPTNVAFTSPEGRFIDCADYREEHYDRQGETSLGQGYGTIFVNPAAPDFERRLESALSDAPWEGGSLFVERERLLAAHPPRLDKLMSLLGAE